MRAPAGFLLCAVLVRAAVAADAEPLTLAQVLADVRARHPDIRAAAAQAAAGRERIGQAGAWEDPVAGLELQRMNGNTRPFSYDTAEVQLSQKIPLSGNRDRRRAVAAAEADVAVATIRSREFMVVAAARDAFFQLIRIREQLGLLRENDRLLAQAADLVRSRLATGTAEVSTLLVAENERVQLQPRLIALEREAADAAASLNTLRDLPPQSPVGELAAPPPPEKLLTLEDAQAMALAHRPELREADARITAAERSQELAARAWRPDPEVMVRARHNDGAGKIVNDYDTAIAISLPWANDAKYRSAQREAGHRREAATLDAAVLRSRTAAEVRDAWQRLDTARRNVEVYRDRLVPLARSVAETARQGIVTARNTVGDLIMAQRALLAAQTELAANLADYRRFAAMLETLTGTDHS